MEGGVGEVERNGGRGCLTPLHPKALWSSTVCLLVSRVAMQCCEESCCGPIPAESRQVCCRITH